MCLGLVLVHRPNVYPTKGCAATNAPAWEIWRRTSGIGKPPPLPPTSFSSSSHALAAGNAAGITAGTTTGGVNASGAGCSGYSAAAIAAAAAAKQAAVDADAASLWPPTERGGRGTGAGAAADSDARGGQGLLFSLVGFPSPTCAVATTCDAPPLPSCGCCDLPPPLAWAAGSGAWVLPHSLSSGSGGVGGARVHHVQTVSGGGRGVSCALVPAPGSGGTGWSACPAALRALAAHLSKAKEQKELRRDLGRLLQAGSLLQKPPPPNAGSSDENNSSSGSGGGDAGVVMPVAPAHAHNTAGGSLIFGGVGGGGGGGDTSYFRAGGGAFLPLTPHAAVLRHRAALHVQLVAACLAAGLADQAGMCLRQLCGALSGRGQRGEVCG